MLRFSIRQLLGFTAAVGIGCVALLNASQIWAASMMAGLVAGLVASLLLAIFRNGAARNFWTGFAITGWLYLLICFYGFASEPTVAMNPRTSNYNSNPFARDNLITARASGLLYDQLLAEQRRQSIVHLNPTGTRTVVLPRIDRDNFIAVAHVLWASLFAVCGGWFAQWLYYTPTNADAKTKD